jgi:hypothetical protein
MRMRFVENGYGYQYISTYTITVLLRGTPCDLGISAALGGNAAVRRRSVLERCWSDLFFLLSERSRPKIA